MVRAIECEGVLDPDVVEAAFRAVVARTPIARTRIVRPPDHTPYFALSETGPPITIGQGAREHRLGEFVEEFNHPLVTDESVMRMRVVLDDPGGQILLACHHGVTDGRGLQTFWHELVEEYERRIAGEVADVPAPSAVSLPPTLDESLPEWLRGDGVDQMLTAFVEANATYYGAAPPAVFANERGSSTEPSRTRVAHCDLSAEMSARIRDVAREHGTTMQGAIAASLLKTAAEAGKASASRTPRSVGQPRQAVWRSS